MKEGDVVIPKIIHYCWFGGSEPPELVEKCIKSWEKYLPEYEIIKWSEDNFDISLNQYAKEAYSAGKFAFVADYARLYLLYHYGGIYMDADVEVLKSLDRFLYEQAFSGFEGEKTVPTGIIGSIRGLHLMSELLGYYENRSFKTAENEYDTTTNTKVMTDFFLQKGLNPNNTLQTVESMTFYPKEFICPNNYATRKIVFTNNTYTIHHFAGSWLPEEIRRQFGTKRYRIKMCCGYLKGKIAMFLTKFRNKK
jgi:hypothetical protein